MSGLKPNLIQIINHTLTSNHLSRSICVNLLNNLEVCLDFLSFSLYKKDGPPSNRKSLVKTDVNILRVRPDHVRPIVFSSFYSWLLQWFFFTRHFLLYHHWLGKALIYKWFFLANRPLRKLFILGSIRHIGFFF